VVICAVLALGWAALATMERLSEQDRARQILHSAIRDPLRERLQQTVDEGTQLQAVDEDLIAYDAIPDLTAETVRGAAEILAERRADELYQRGIPPDPGRDRTYVGIPRPILDQLSEHRHELLGNAVVAGLVALGAGLVLAAAMGSRATIFALPAVGLALAHVLGLSQLWVIDRLFDRSTPNAELLVVVVRDSAREPMNYLLWGAAGLAAAALVFRAVYTALAGRDAPAPSAGAAEDPASSPG
jgi:hypothetical protein